MAHPVRWLEDKRHVEIVPRTASSHTTQMVATVLKRKGFRQVRADALATIDDRLEHYIQDFIEAAQDLAESCGRTKADLRDFAELMKEDGLAATIAEEDDDDVAVQFGRIPELKDELKRNRRRSMAGKGYVPAKLARYRVPLSPPPKAMLALPTDDLPEPLQNKVTDYADDAGWLPDLPPRHTWMRTYPKAETSGTPSMEGVEAEMVEPNPAAQPARVTDGQNAPDPAAITPVITSAASAPAPPPPKLTVKVQRTSHLSQQSVKYLVSTLSESSDIPLELGIINHRQKPMALKRRERDKSGANTGGEEAGRYDIFGEIRKKRKVVFKKSNDGTWVGSGA